METVTFMMKIVSTLDFPITICDLVGTTTNTAEFIFRKYCENTGQISHSVRTRLNPPPPQLKVLNWQINSSLRFCWKRKVTGRLYFHSHWSGTKFCSLLVTFFTEWSSARMWKCL